MMKIMMLEMSEMNPVCCPPPLLVVQEYTNKIYNHAFSVYT